MGYVVLSMTQIATLSDIITIASEVGISKSIATQIVQEISDICNQAKMAKFIIK